MTPTDQQIADLQTKLARLEAIVRELQAKVKALGG